MAFSTTVQHVEKPVAPKTTPSNDISDALFSMVILSVYGAQMSKKTLRKMKRQFFWQTAKLQPIPIIKILPLLLAMNIFITGLVTELPVEIGSN